MKKIALVMAGVLCAMGLTVSPASAAPYDCISGGEPSSRSTTVSWGCAEARSGEGYLNAYVDDLATDGYCVYLRARRPGSTTFNTVPGSKSCGPVISVGAYLGYNFAEVRLTREDGRYSTLR